MSFQDVAQGSRPPSRGTVPELLRGADTLVRQVDAQAAALRAKVDGSKDKFDTVKTKGQVQEAFKMGNQAATLLKDLRDRDPQNIEANDLRLRLTNSLATLRNIHNAVLAHEKKANAAAKSAVKMAKREVRDTIEDQGEVSDPEATENEALMEAQRRRQKFRQMQSEIATNEAIIAERETGIQEIESALTEIGKIMKDMCQDIARQGEQLDHIEDHIEQTLGQTKAGVVEVKKAMKQQKKSRKWMCCLLFFVTGLVAAIVVYFSVFY